MSLCEPTDPTDVAGRLNYACQLGHSAFVERIVKECGVKNFDLLDQYGSPPLYNAVLKNDCPQLVKYLLERGATVGLKNADNETAFFISVFNSHLESAKVLQAAGGKVDEKGGVYGDYPLHAAVKNNREDMVGWLLASGANVNCRNDENETPLFIACKLNRKKLAYDLLMNKANKSLASDGKDCLFIASERGNKDCVRLLKANGPAELMQVNKSLGEAKPEKPANKPSWREVEFQQELRNLGITEEEAVRKPREVPQPIVRKKKREPGVPLPLFDSDEDMDDRAERIAREQPQVPAPVRKYRDPEGTNFNPADPSHLQDIINAREAFKNYKPPEGRPVAPKPGLVEPAATDVIMADGEGDEPPTKRVRSPQTKPLGAPMPKTSLQLRHSEKRTSSLTRRTAAGGKPGAAATPVATGKRDRSTGRKP